MRFPSGGLSRPSITTSSWFSAIWPLPPPNMPPGPGTALLANRTKRDGPGRSGARSSNCFSRHARVSSTRSVACSNVGSSNPPMTLPPPRELRRIHGVDLVDEDDALPAPLAREPLRLAREVADEDRVEPDERLGEARARDGDERRVEARGDRLREHGLAGAGRAEEEQAAFPLAAGALEALTGLPQRDDAADLLLRLGLPANVLELHAPLGVAGLVAADLRDAHREHRAHEDQEVEEEEERQRDERPEGLRVPDHAQAVPDLARGLRPAEPVPEEV